MELYLNIDVGMGGWRLQMDEESVALEEGRSAPSSGMLIGPAGPAARIEVWGRVAEPWPSLARGAGPAIDLKGRILTEIEWDAGWDLQLSHLQAGRRPPARRPAAGEGRLVRAGAEPRRAEPPPPR